MRKLFILSLLAMMIAWGIGGCGGGVEGTSADPLGTDVMMFGHKENPEGTEWSTAGDVTLRGTIILTAKIKNSSDKPVIGREVSFGFVSNTSGATLSSINANTGSTGEASIIYTAGMTAGFDVVQASISNGSTLIMNITVGGGTGSYQITLAADNTSLAAGQTAVLTATVTNGSDVPVVGVVVTFGIPVNNTGAAAPTPLNGGRTDAGGKAVAYYTPGDWGGGSYQDTVTASVSGASSAIVFTRVSDTPQRITLTLAADSANVKANQSTTLTATVLDGNSDPVALRTVSFEIVTAGSGSPTLRELNFVTDADGKARVTYTAGATGTTQDVIRARVYGDAGSILAAGEVIITVAGGGGEQTYGIAVTASPATLTADNSNSVVNATVTSGTTAISGVTVTFTVTGGGTVPAPGTATTDGSGKAVITFTGGPAARAAGETDVVSASITVGGNIYTNAAVITYP